MKLLLIRHGETNAKLQMRWSGYNDLVSTNLTAAGINQAEKLSTWFQINKIKPTHIYSSPQIRSRTTCSISTNFLGLPIRILSDLRETNAGIFEGLTWQEIEDKYPKEASIFVDSRNWTHIKNSENDIELL